MKLFLNAVFCLAVAASPVLAPSHASAQQRYVTQEQGVLVAPDGTVLDYLPNPNDVVISRDRMGRTVYYDRYGNLVGTQMPAALNSSGRLRATLTRRSEIPTTANPTPIIRRRPADTASLNSPAAAMAIRRISALNRVTASTATTASFAMMASATMSILALSSPSAAMSKAAL